MSKPREPGLLRGFITIVSDDDEHLKDFAEYMPSPDGEAAVTPTWEGPMEPVVEFSSAQGQEAAEQFQKWQSAHPTGFYVNVKSLTRGILHRVDCFHVGGVGEWDPAAGDVAHRAKLCSDSRESLTRWAAERQLDLASCSDCKL
jgi:hypothetical protein